MSRVWRPRSLSATRSSMVRSLATALRRCGIGEVPEKEQKDLLAFMALLLSDIDHSVEQAAAAWEKRGYWLKADQFRRQWEWVVAGREGLDKALAANDMAAAAGTLARLAASVAGTDVKMRPASAAPWQGAWEHWLSRQSAGSNLRREQGPGAMK